MFKSCLRQATARPTSSSLPTRSTAPSIASFNTRAHQRRHSSSSKPPVPPNNGSPTIPTDVKQVATRSDAKSEGKKAASDRLSKRKAAAAAKAEVQEAQDNWTSSLPSVPSLHHLSPKGKDYLESSNSSELTKRRCRPIEILRHAPTHLDIWTRTQGVADQRHRKTLPAQTSQVKNEGHLRSHLHFILRPQHPHRTHRARPAKSFSIRVSLTPERPATNGRCQRQAIRRQDRQRERRAKSLQALPSTTRTHRSDVRANRATRATSHQRRVDR